MKAVCLRCNYMENPVGFDFERPLLSWMTEEEGRNRSQSAFQVQVSTEEAFANPLLDTGKAASGESAGWNLPLDCEAMTRYFWRVRVWNNDDEGSEWSETAYFETARGALPWKAEWIGWKREHFPELKKIVCIDKPVRRARAYACGVGLYRLFVNGEIAGDEYLNPNFNAYGSWLQYQTFDIGAQLKQGENVLGAWLGNGYYKGRVNWPGIAERRNIYGDRLALIAQIEIEYEDGTHETIVTDESWQAKESPFDRAEIYDGEIYDARREGEQGQWEGVEIVAIDKALLQARRSVPVRVMEKRPVEQVLHDPEGRIILDFGQNFAGWVRMRVHEPEGTQIRIRYGEMLCPDGSLYTENLRTAKAELIYISSGRPAEYAPSFTFYGFRYAEITGVSDFDPADFMGEVIYSDMPVTGAFECSDPRVNRLFLNALWSQKGNFVDTPTDCPQRDERMGWTGDAQVFCPTACMNMQTDAFYRKYLYDMKIEQAVDGYVPVVVPNILRGSGEWPFPVTAWGDAAVIMPWELYVYYGDRDTLAAQYQSMKDWVDYITNSGNVADGIYGGYHLGDWVAQDTKDPDNLFGLTPTELVATAYYAKSAELVGKAAAVLGYAEDAKTYGGLAEEVREAFRREFVSPAGRVSADNQTASALALCMDMLLPQQRAKAAERLAFRLRVDKMHLTTGFVGTPVLCPALSENGYNEYAYGLLLSEGCPGWLYEVEMGATTMWERWNSLREDGSFGAVEMNSFNHYAFGSVAEWMYRYMCGLNPDESAPGFRRAVVRPLPNSQLGYAKASILTPYGRLGCGWVIEGETLRVTVEIPCNASAVITLPDTQGAEIVENGVSIGCVNGFERGSGRWEYVYRFSGETIHRRPVDYDPRNFTFGGEKPKETV